MQRWQELYLGKEHRWHCPGEARHCPPNRSREQDGSSIHNHPKQPPWVWPPISNAGSLTGWHNHSTPAGTNTWQSQWYRSSSTSSQSGLGSSAPAPALELHAGFGMREQERGQSAEPGAWLGERQPRPPPSPLPVRTHTVQKLLAVDVLS